MTKLLPSLALVLLASTGLALPAVAESDSFNSFNESYQLIRLRDAGVSATAAYENTSGTMRVTLKGSNASVIYDIDSLQPLNGAGGEEVTGSIKAARPAVQHSAPVVSTDSLLYEGDGSH